MSLPVIHTAAVRSEFNLSIEYDINVIKNRFNEARLFTRQFGTFTKTDYETLMFTI